MNRYSKVKDNPFLVKNHNNNAVVNTNVQGYYAAKERKKRYKENLQLKEELKTLQYKMTQIEKLFSQIK